MIAQINNQTVIARESVLAFEILVLFEGIFQANFDEINIVKIFFVFYFRGRDYTGNYTEGYIRKQANSVPTFITSSAAQLMHYWHKFMRQNLCHFYFENAVNITWRCGHKS